MTTILNFFKTDPFRMRRLAESVDREMSHVSDQLLKNQIGFNRAELAREVVAEVDREQTQATARAKKRQLEAAAALAHAEAEVRESEAGEARKRYLVDAIRTGLEAIAALQAQVDGHPAEVQAAKAQAASSAADLAKRPDDIAALRILQTQADQLAVLPHHLEAAKAALAQIQREITELQSQLDRIK